MADCARAMIQEVLHDLDRRITTGKIFAVLYDDDSIAALSREPEQLQGTDHAKFGCGCKLAACRQKG
jgi:hypothetical protein